MLTYTVGGVTRKNTDVAEPTILQQEVSKPALCLRENILHFSRCSLKTKALRMVQVKSSDDLAFMVHPASCEKHERVMRRISQQVLRTHQATASVQSKRTLESHFLVALASGFDDDLK